MPSRTSHCHAKLFVNTGKATAGILDGSDLDGRKVNVKDNDPNAVRGSGTRGAAEFGRSGSGPRPSGGDPWTY